MFGLARDFTNVLNYARRQLVGSAPIVLLEFTGAHVYSELTRFTDDWDAWYRDRQQAQQGEPVRLVIVIRDRTGTRRALIERAGFVAFKSRIYEIDDIASRDPANVLQTFVVDARRTGDKWP